MGWGGGEKTGLSSSTSEISEGLTSVIRGRNEEGGWALMWVGLSWSCPACAPLPYLFWHTLCCIIGSGTKQSVVLKVWWAISEILRILLGIPWGQNYFHNNMKTFANYFHALRNVWWSFPEATRCKSNIINAEADMRVPNCFLLSQTLKKLTKFKPVPLFSLFCFGNYSYFF